MEFGDLIKYGYNATKDESDYVTIPLVVETEHKGPVWERPVYIQATFYLASATTGKWSPIYGGTTVTSECSNAEGRQEYLRVYPSDDTCEPMIDLLQLRTGCAGRLNCSDRTNMTEEASIKCVPCPEGGNCLTELLKLDDGRVVPQPGMFLWRVGQVNDYWRIPWAPPRRHC
jgi:hypothetical protein